MEHQGGNCQAGGPPLAPRPAHQMQNAMLCSLQFALYLEGGELVVLNELSPGGLNHHLAPWCSDPDTGLDLVIWHFSGD